MAVGDERSPAWLEHVDKRRKEVMAVAAEAEQQHNQSNAEDPVASVDAEPEEDEPDLVVARRQRPQHNRVTSSQDREKDARARAMGSQQDTQLQTSSSPQASRGVKRKQQSRETSSAHSESASDSELQLCTSHGVKRNHSNASSDSSSRDDQPAGSGSQASEASSGSAGTSEENETGEAGASEDIKGSEARSADSSSSTSSIQAFRDDAPLPDAGHPTEYAGIENDQASSGLSPAAELAAAVSQLRHGPRGAPGVTPRDRAVTPEQTLEDAPSPHATEGNTTDGRLPQYHPLDEDWLGQVWFPKKADAVKYQTALQHALIASCDMSASGGFKKFSSFLDAGAFVSYLMRLQAEGVDLNHYECLAADTPSKFYVDIDYVAETRDDEDFQERFHHCITILRCFLERILSVPPESISFQVAHAHGALRSGAYKYSAHVCLQRFYLRDSSVRRDLKKSLGLFLKKPPEDMRRSCEFLFYRETKDRVCVDKCLVDTAVYSSFQNWRTLFSEKKASGRPLVPAPGSSSDIKDHMVGFHTPADRAEASELDGGLLAAYNLREEPTALAYDRPRADPARGVRGTFVERGQAPPLTDIEKDRLLRRYQKDHEGAWILRVESMNEDTFTVHFGVNTPYCWIAGRAHHSPGNACGYLVYKRSVQSQAFYRCHSRGCSGTTLDGSGRRLQRILQLDSECIESWDSDYSIVGRMRGYPTPQFQPSATHQTTLVMAGMGQGKSVELFGGLLPRVPPEASICLIAPNITLAQKYHEDTERKNLGFVCYLDEPGGSIDARRVVVCVNSIARVLPRFDLVVMDEANFTLTNMASTVMKDKKVVFMALEGVVAGAKAAFLCDAHLNCPRVVEWIKALRHTSRFYNIRNRGVRETKRTAFIRRMPGKLVGRGQPHATYSVLVDIIVDHVARGKTVMVPATSKTFVELLEAAFMTRLPEKKLLAFHGGKREEAERALLQHAISNPNEALIADCLAFTPTIGPGVSIEKPRSYDLVIAVAVNSDNHPDAHVLMQQIQRARDAGDIHLYFGSIPSRRKIVYPTTKEEVFQMLESSDSQLAELMQGVSVDHLDMLRAGPGERAIYDRTSVTCNLYANNLLGRMQSRQYYTDLVTEDLRRQGVAVVNQLSLRAREADEGVQQGAAEELVDETIEEWRERHLISFEDFERIRGLLSSPSGGVSKEDVLRYEVFHAATFCFGVEYGSIDPKFVSVYVQGKHAKDLMMKFRNYERFVTSTYASNGGTFGAAIARGEERQNIQEYLEVRDRSANGIAYAWCVLAALTGVPPEEVENTVFKSYRVVEGLSGGERLAEVFDMDDFKMSGSLEILETIFKPRTSFVGKELTPTRKRNVIKMILEGGLGLTLRLARFSHGVRQGSHRIVPIQKWEALDEQYGGLKDKLVEMRRCKLSCLIDVDE